MCTTGLKVFCHVRHNFKEQNVESMNSLSPASLLFTASQILTIHLGQGLTAQLLSSLEYPRHMAKGQTTRPLIVSSAGCVRRMCTATVSPAAYLRSVEARAPSPRRDMSQGQHLCPEVRLLKPCRPVCIISLPPPPPVRAGSILSVNKVELS